jgi:nucleoid-associated protein YgaU
MDNRQHPNKNGSRAGRSTIQFACGFSTRRSATSRLETAAADRSAPEAGESSQVRLPSKKRPPSAVVVSRGDSLWRISRATYGSGELYPASESKPGPNPRPDLIYPGQSFILPRRAR